MEYDIQVGRFSTLTEFDFSNWRGIPIELGARGGLVQLWGIHHYLAQAPVSTDYGGLWASALSSNPDHVGDIALGLDEFIGSPALYGTMTVASGVSTTVTGAQSSRYWAMYTPLYGIVRPRRQVWVLYLVIHEGFHRMGIEVYYSEIEAGRVDEDAVNRKFGKYRRA